VVGFCDVEIGDEVVMVRIADGEGVMGVVVGVVSTTDTTGNSFVFVHDSKLLLVLFNNR
jgi:hypothetical protein